jgi:hypothetical protein
MVFWSHHCLAQYGFNLPSNVILRVFLHFYSFLYVSTIFASKQGVMTRAYSDRISTGA